MFWKVVGGITAFFFVVVLAVALLATAGAVAVGAAVGSIVEDLDISTVQVTDARGNTETYDVDNLLSESGRVVLSGDKGERVTIDLNVPQITVQEAGEDGARVVVGGGSRFNGNLDVPQIHINGRNIDNFDGSFIGRVISGFFQGMFKLAFWSLVLVAVWLVLRNRRPAAETPKEKTPDAVA